MNSKIIGKLKKITTKKKQLSIDVNALNNGFNEIDDFIISKSCGKINYVVDKVCDHNGGRLILKEDRAICPNHNWILNLNSLEYNNSSLLKEKYNFKIIDERLNLVSNDDHLINPFLGEKNGSVSIRWLNHACIHISNEFISFIIDPWLLGPSFSCGWWLDNPSPEDSIKIMKDSDFVIISHNHPDHLHAETLSYLDYDTKFIIPDFKSKSTENYLRSLGFNNLYILDFLDLFQVKKDIQISALKSGDFRDDSGFYININGFQILLCVDSNYLNSYVLPKNIDLLCTSFASGATGFPLIYEGIKKSDKTRVLIRNKNSAIESIRNYINTTKPKYFLPYAGMFKEKAKRDNYILCNNRKNDLKQIKNTVKNLNTKFIKPENDKLLSFKGDNFLEIKSLKINYFEKDNIQDYLNLYKKNNPFDSDKILEYFRRSNFSKKQILHIIPTNDNFIPITDNIIYIDFFKNIYRFQKAVKNIKNEIAGYNNMIIKVRVESLMHIIKNHLPWEDLTIGFQCRILRFPDVYESDFWYYFTNVYVNKKNIRYSSNCGSCKLIDQSSKWY